MIDSDRPCQLRSVQRALLITSLLMAGAGCERLGDDALPSADTEAARPDEAVTPEVDEIRRMAGCLAERGIATTLEADGAGFSAEPGALDQEQFRAVIEECKNLTGAGSTPPAQLTPDEIRAVYDRWIETAECLRSQGYEPDEPTSVQAFVDAWSTGGAWNPYLSIETDSSEEFARLNQLCPQ